MVYFLCRNDKDEYTILTAVADAACEPSVARNIPAEVMEELFMDAFVGFVLPRPVIPERFAARVPVKVDTHYAFRPPIAKPADATEADPGEASTGEASAVAGDQSDRRWVPAIGPA
jgi:hypothetical protein